MTELLSAGQPDAKTVQFLKTQLRNDAESKINSSEIFDPVCHSFVAVSRVFLNSIQVGSNKGYLLL